MVCSNIGNGCNVIDDSHLLQRLLSCHPFKWKYILQVSNITDGVVKNDSALLCILIGAPRIVSVSRTYAVIGYNATIQIVATGTHFLQGIDSLRLRNWNQS